MPGRVILVRKDRKKVVSSGKKLEVAEDHWRVKSATRACQDATSKTTPPASRTPTENLQPHPSTCSSRPQALETQNQTSITASDFQNSFSQPDRAHTSSVIDTSLLTPTSPVPPSTKPTTKPYLKETPVTESACSNSPKATVKITAKPAVLERTNMSVSVPCCSKEPDPSPYPTLNTPSTSPEIVYICCSGSTNPNANGTFKVPPRPPKRAPKTSVASIVRSRAAGITPKATVIATLAPIASMQRPRQGQRPTGRATVALTASVASNAAPSSTLVSTPVTASTSRDKPPKRKYNRRKSESEKRTKTGGTLEDETPKEEYLLDAQRQSANELAFAYKMFHNFRRLRFLFPKIPANALNDLLVLCDGQLATVIDKIMKEDKKARTIAVMNCNRNPADQPHQAPRQPFPQNQGMQQMPYTNPQPPGAPTCQRNANDTYRFNNPQFHSDSHSHFAVSNGNQFHQNNWSYAQGQIAPPRQSGHQAFDTIGHMAVDAKNGCKEPNNQSNNVNWQQPNMQYAPVHTSGGMSGDVAPPRPAPRGGTMSAGINSFGVRIPGSVAQRLVPQEMGPQMCKEDAQCGFGPSGMLHSRLMAQGGMPGEYYQSRISHPQLMAQGVVSGGYGSLGMMPSGMPAMMTPQSMAEGMQQSGTQAMSPGMIFSGMVQSDHSQRMVQGMVHMNVAPDMVTGMARPPRSSTTSLQPPQVAPQSQYANSEDCIPSSIQYNGAVQSAAAVAGFTFSTSYASLTATTADFQHAQQANTTKLSDDQRITQLLQLEQKQQHIQRHKEQLQLQQQHQHQNQQQNQQHSDRQQQEHQQQQVEQLKKQQLQHVVHQRLQQQLQRLLKLKQEQQQQRLQQQQHEQQKQEQQQQHNYIQEQHKLLQKQMEHHHQQQLQVNQEPQQLHPIRDPAPAISNTTLHNAFDVSGDARNAATAAELNAAIDSLRKEIALVDTVTANDSLSNEVYEVFKIMYSTDTATPASRGVNLSTILPENVPQFNGKLPAGRQGDIAGINGPQEVQHFENVQINMGQFNEDSTPLDAIGQEEWVPDTSQLYSSVFSDDENGTGSDQLMVSANSPYPMVVDNEALPSAVTPKKCAKNRK